MKPLIASLATVLALALPQHGLVAQTPPPASAAAAPSYVQLVDLALAAPVIVRATVSRTQRIRPADAPGLAPGQARLLLTTDVEAVLVAPDALPARLSWLSDVPLDARGRAPDLRGTSWIAFLQAPDSAGRTALVSGNAQQPWSSDFEARLRAIATELASGTVPVVTGVSNGFRVPGTIPGEAESQFFLGTADGKPLTMVVLDRPGQRRQIQVASTDIIDESATSVQPDTLLWYRLACALPARLPAAAGGNDPALANAWASAIASLGPCTR